MLYANISSKIESEFGTRQTGVRKLIQEKLLTENEGALLAGVSLETIREYIRIGLLETVDESGKSLLKSNDLSALFGLEATNGRGNNLRVLDGGSQSNVEQNTSTGQGAEESPAVFHAPVPTNHDLVFMNKRLKDEVLELKQERAWLRERLEKLEARSEREQTLLLNENETVRKLLATTPQPGFWQSFFSLWKS